MHIYVYIYKTTINTNGSHEFIKGAKKVIPEALERGRRKRNYLFIL